MDLVEIRKKARQNKKRKPAENLEREADVSLPESTGPLSSSVAEPQSEPGPVESVAPLRDESVVGPVTGEMKPADGDALERLFRSQDQLCLATEESYLQAMQGEVEDARQVRQRWLSFALGKERYAINIEFVKEIIKPRQITSIPRVPEFLLGIISLRGLIVPVIDLRRRLHLGEIVADDNTRILVCEDGDRIAGLLVDSITQVVQLGEDEIEPPPAVLSGLDRELVAGVGRIQGQMVILLDLPQVLDMELN